MPQDSELVDLYNRRIKEYFINETGVDEDSYKIYKDILLDIANWKNLHPDRQKQIEEKIELLKQNDGCVETKTGNRSKFALANFLERKIREVKNPDAVNNFWASGDEEIFNFLKRGKRFIDNTDMIPMPSGAGGIKTILTGVTNLAMLSARRELRARYQIVVKEIETALAERDALQETEGSTSGQQGDRAEALSGRLFLLNKKLLSIGEFLHGRPEAPENLEIQMEESQKRLDSQFLERKRSVQKLKKSQQEIEKLRQENEELRKQLDSQKRERSNIDESN